MPVLNDIDRYVDIMYEIIKTHSYIPRIPKEKDIHDHSSNKDRTIGVQPYFPDGLMQQLVVEVMKNVLMRGMHRWCCASIPDRGGHDMLRRSKKLIQRQQKSSRYIAELDVKQFYPSTPQAGVIRALERKIKDKTFLRLIAVIISCNQLGLAGVEELDLTPEEIVGDRVGMHIGFYINQWLENYYLETADRAALSQRGVKVELRYMDNINISGSNKRQLHRAVRAISAHLRTLGLRLKENWQLYKVDARPLSTVGYRIGRDFVILRKRNFLRLARQCRRVLKKIKQHKPIPFKQAQSLLSRVGQLCHCNNYRIFQKYIKPIGLKRLKNIVRAESLRARCA